MINSLETPSIIYSASMIQYIIDLLKDETAKIKNLKIFFSMKSNNNINILNFLSKKIDGIEIASEYEYKKIENLGFKNIISTFPTPTSSFLEEFYNSGYVFDFDSIDILKLNIDFLKNKKIGLRIALPPNKPNIIDNDFSRFGLFGNEPELIKLVNEFNLEVCQLHFHNGENNIKNIKMTTTYISKLLNEYSIYNNIKRISLGGGLNNLYFKDKNSTEYWSIVEHFSNEVNSKTDVDIIIEPGFLMMSLCGFLISSVCSIKQVNDIYKYVTLDSSAFNLFSWYKPDIIYPKKAENQKQKVNFYGRTCFENDVFVKNTSIPIENIGDKVVLTPVAGYCTSSCRHLHMIPSPNEYFCNDEVNYE